MKIALQGFCQPLLLSEFSARGFTNFRLDKKKRLTETLECDLHTVSSYVTEKMFLRLIVGTFNETITVVLFAVNADVMFVGCSLNL